MQATFGLRPTACPTPASLALWTFSRQSRSRPHAPPEGPRAPEAALAMAREPVDDLPQRCGASLRVSRFVARICSAISPGIDSDLGPAILARARATHVTRHSTRTSQ